MTLREPLPKLPLCYRANDLELPAVSLGAGQWFSLPFGKIIVPVVYCPSLKIPNLTEPNLPFGSHKIFHRIQIRQVHIFMLYPDAAINNIFTKFQQYIFVIKLDLVYVFVTLRQTQIYMQIKYKSICQIVFFAKKIKTDCYYQLFLFARKKTLRPSCETVRQPELRFIHYPE